MAEERAPDFTFAIGDEPDPKVLAPIYAQIMAGRRPALSLGAVSRDAAVTWLQDRHDRYRSGVGKRSGIVGSMKLEDRVDLVGLAP